ncbi:hypothetical protein ACOXXX_01305 [Thalassococcus sp. BH17M4-6]|uniref:hypothetical protein n=1 Tax=Thalassococcus sp. BH17M4-6 TaxID=3413148 RepID=UPI003BE928EA
MSSLMEPNYTLLAFLFAQKFVYAEAVFVLALLRALLATAAARFSALLAAALAAAITLTVFAPALNLQAHPVYPVATRALDHGQGMTALLCLMAVMLASGVLPGHRHRWIDALHGLLCLGLLGLWIATMF